MDTSNGLDAQTDAADAPFTCQVPGTLDRSFGLGGVVAPIFGLVPGKLSAASAVLVDSSQRIVVAGGTEDARRGCAVVRLLPDGTRDPSFGASGVVLTGVADECWFEDITLQPDGKLVAAGGVNEDIAETSFTHRIVVMRFLPNGDLDPAFGQNGIVITAPAPYAHAVAVAVDASNRIVVAAEGWDSFGPPDVAHFVTLRYQSNGQPDPTFGNAGVAEPAFQNVTDLAYDLALQPDGKILVSGTTNMYVDTKLGVARYNSNGTLDTQFGSNGLATIDAPAMLGTMALDSSGRIVLAGDHASDGGLLARMQANGTIDPSFNVVGTATVSDMSYSRAAITSRGIYATGRGPGSGPGLAVLGLARYGDTGLLDTTFGVAGFGEFPTGHDWYSGLDLAEQPDEKIVVVGAMIDALSPDAEDFLIARYCP